MLIKFCFKMLDFIATGRFVNLLVAVICALHLFGVLSLSYPDLAIIALIALLDLYIISIKDYDRLREIGQMRIVDRIVKLENSIKAIEAAKKEIAESVEHIKLKE